MNRRRVGLVAAWVVATSMATLLASQAVALVRDQVTDRPSRVATTLALETTIPTTTPRTAVTTTTTSQTAATSTTITQAETTTTAPPQMTTTSVPLTSSTTTTTIGHQEETFYLTGGWATVWCADDAVTLATHAPNPGYQVDIESAGPNELEIKFEEAGGDHESRLQVDCDDGVLKPDIKEHDDD